MILLPFFISCAIGYFLISLLFKNFRPFSSGLHIALSVGLGWGVSGLLTFLLFLIVGHYDRTAILGLNIFILFALMTANIIFSKQKAYTQQPLSKKINLITILTIPVWIALYLAVSYTANAHPYGEWDAWAIWNMKTKFLIFGGDNWKWIYTKLDWSARPDYPLLLSLINVWNYAVSQIKLVRIPLMTAVMLTFSTGLLLQFALKRFASPAVGLLAIVILLANPFFIFQATSQYADSLLGYYLLAGFVTVSLLFRERNDHYAYLAGSVFGLLAATKNEGMVMSIIFLMLISVYTLTDKTLEHPLKIKMLKKFFLSLLVSALATMYLKTFLAQHSHDIIVDPRQTQLNYFNQDGLALIFKSTVEEMINKRWSCIWIFTGVLILLGNRQLFWNECKIFSLFFIIYAVILVIVYTTTTGFDLSWRIKNTLARILSYFLPSVLYFAFYINWRRTQETSHAS